jgi:hypothetical protein
VPGAAGAELTGAAPLLLHPAASAAAIRIAGTPLLI